MNLGYRKLPNEDPVITAQLLQGRHLQDPDYGGGYETKTGNSLLQTAYVLLRPKP